MITLFMWLIVLLFIPCLASAEFDVKEGDTYYLNDGTPAIVISISRDKTEITVSPERYQERKAAEEREIQWRRRVLRGHEVWGLEKIANE